MPSPLPATTAFAQSFAMSGFAASDRLPLHGLTLLAVEDSRYASEALRLMCQRAGARLRRAETLAAARAHLRVYRPDVVIVDLGLPDGKGEALIRDLVLARPRPGLVLGTSGAASGRSLALASGADGFLEKPLESYASFCAALLAHLPDLADLQAPPAADPIHPDTLALHDDLSHAALLLASAPDAAARRYLAGFVHGLAGHSHDMALADAASRAMRPGDTAAFDDLRDLIDRRLATAEAGFVINQS